jgi:hypothetical protein
VIGFWTATEFGRILDRVLREKVWWRMSRKNRRKPGWNPLPALTGDQPFTALELDFFQRGDEIVLEGEGALFGSQNALVGTAPLISRSSSF